jgi:urease
MKLSPHEEDKLALVAAGQLAQRRLARGVLLNAPEATALVATVCLELIRDGRSVAELMALGRTLLGRRNVARGVAALVPDVQVEGTFRDGTKLVTVHEPICREQGDLALALHGSFLPVPPASLFAAAEDHADLVPGEVIVANAPPIELNAGRARLRLRVVSTCDRPIQVGSHFHFAEVNAALRFDRALAFGYRLNLPAGSAVRFEPGEARTVTLVRIGGERMVQGGNSLAIGLSPFGDSAAADGVELLARCAARGFAHEAQLDAGVAADGVTAPDVMRCFMSRAHYAATYGPTTGDRVRLGDSCLLALVERGACTRAARTRLV